MPKLAFGTQTTRVTPVRAMPSKYDTSKLRRELEQGDAGGMRPVGAFYPWKYLPVQFQDTETGDWLVLVKGRIVSLITNQTLAASGETNTATGISGGIPDITSSGTILVYNDATTAAATFTALNIDDSYWGYHDSAAGLLVPANAGVAARYTYSADDATAGTTKPDTTLVAQNGDTVNLPANIPAGIVFTDVFQDIRGKNLNYDLWASIYGILCDGLIVAPFCDYGDTTPQSTATFAATIVASTSSASGISATDDAGYNAVYRKHTFFYFDSTADVMSGQSGKALRADSYGQFVAQGTEASMTRTTAATEQTIGHLLYTDSRYPKDGIESVDTYYSSGLMGTETGGLPALLYNFAYDAMGGMSLTRSISEVVDMVQAGVFGLAYIQIER